MVDTARIMNTVQAQFYKQLSSHKSISVGVSGGSDSDIIVHIIATYYRQFLPKVHFVFSNTGIEYRATLDHIKYLEEHYNIHINRIRPDYGNKVGAVVRREGLPLFSKRLSEYIRRLQEHGFQWEDEPFEVLTKRYPNCSAALKWWCNEWGNGSRFNIEQKRYLKGFIVSQHGIPFQVSAECCHYSKKTPMKQFQNNIKADLRVSGERKAEGGQRATIHKNCFETGSEIDMFMPLFFWTDEDKAWYKEHEGIRYSDCYEVYGLKRTGCVGCPFALGRKEELEIMQKYEPDRYKVCMVIFGKAYEYMDEYKRQATFDRLGYEQLKLF